MIVRVCVCVLKYRRLRNFKTTDGRVLRPFLCCAPPFFNLVLPVVGFKFRGRCLRRRSGFSMAELISFVVPTQSDKVLLVWELSAGPPAEALSVRGRAEEGRGNKGKRGTKGNRGTGGSCPRARAEGEAQRTREPAEHP